MPNNLHVMRRAGNTGYIERAARAKVTFIIDRAATMQPCRRMERKVAGVDSH